MCGIFGIITRNARVPGQVLERATKSLAHRGPDDSGTVILQDTARESIEIGLGNRRLAILDLSPLGHQPMSDPSTGNWIVYNGEVYNFREVRAKLEQEGLHFSSASDTEVILKAYGQWGEKCLLEFHGMFAFAIWDAQRHRLFVARDPMGIKPLYFCKSDQYFIFSSEVRTLLGTGLIPRCIDPAGLDNYLSFGSLYDPLTLVQGVNSLRPGCCLTWQDGQVREAEYWDLIDAGSAELCDQVASVTVERRAELEQEIGKMLDESVRMQLVSDVPVGVFLSGGIDSSSLVGILSRNGVRPRTFSIVFQEADYSEAEYSRAVAAHFCTDHHEITVSQADFFDAIGPAVDAMDLPTIDGINTYFVAEKARAAGVKVALSGLGGDELFAGYSSFRTVPRMETFAKSWACMPKMFQSTLRQMFVALAPASDQNRKFAALASNGAREFFPYFISRMLFTPEQQSELLPRIMSKSANFLRAQASMNETATRATGLDPINRVSYLEARCYMLNTLLRDSDSMSMAHGLEVRVPLIDHQLARRLLALPGAWKVGGATPKPLLVRALGGQLPENIVHRPKRGFTLPLEHWLRDAMRPAIERAFDRIEDGPLGQMINAEAVGRVWAEFLQGKTSWSRPWALYVLQNWCERHLQS